MPDLSPQQFHQPELDGFYAHHVVPQGLNARLPYRASAEDPPSTHKRGVVGEGQQMLNFDAPSEPLETSRAGLIPVDKTGPTVYTAGQGYTSQSNDPNWDDRAWRVGGMRRIEVEGDLQSEDHPDGPDIVRSWESAPVEMIDPDAQIFTNQVEDGSVQVDEEFVDELRDMGDYAYSDPQTGAPKNPWIAQVAGKRYLLEGHHRAVAGRTSGDGSFPAHVLEADNWDDLLGRAWYAPRNLDGSIRRGT
jgi:hypothetical protein